MRKKFEKKNLDLSHPHLFSSLFLLSDIKKMFSFFLILVIHIKLEHKSMTKMEILYQHTLFIDFLNKRTGFFKKKRERHHLFKLIDTH